MFRLQRSVSGVSFQLSQQLCHVLGSCGAAAASAAVACLVLSALRHLFVNCGYVLMAGEGVRACLLACVPAHWLGTARERRQDRHCTELF
jgi:succinate dehydrogenase/fumarate reductase cytochrome b subunit